MLLTTTEKLGLDGSIARAEKNTGAQIVAAIVPQSDVYPELPWMAFSCGVLLGAGAVIAAHYLSPSWDANLVYEMLIALGTGAISMLVCTLAASFARIFLSTTRAESESLQFAKTLFVDQSLFATGSRCGVLLLASVFERQIIVLPDSGLRARVSPDSWRRVVDAMRAPLRERRYAAAVEIGIATIESELLAAGFRGGAHIANELPDAIIDIDKVP